MFSQEQISRGFLYCNSVNIRWITIKLLFSTSYIIFSVNYCLEYVAKGLEDLVMDIEKVFHMNGGVGHTSYARNSSLQKRASEFVKHMTIGTLVDLYLTQTPNSLGIADLGCSSGNNSLSIIREMVDAVEQVSHKISHPLPELRIYLNDLPANDFNTIFTALPEFYRELQKDRINGAPCLYIAAYPGSFYGRLFPNKCLHFVYSSYSLHWLSKIPQGLIDEQGRSINKGAIYISASSPPQVSKAYYKQFQDDMLLFLRSRSDEVVDGGKMMLILLGRIGANHDDRGNSFLWKLLARSLSHLVSQGEVEEEKLDSYNVHFYAPSREEFEEEVRKDGGFEIEKLEMFEIDREIEDGSSYGMVVASTVRAIQESSIKHHFGDTIVDNLFKHYSRLVDEEMTKDEIKPITFVVALRKKC